MFNLKKFFIKESAVPTFQELTNPVDSLSQTQKLKFADRLQAFSVFMLAAICFLTPLFLLPVGAIWFDFPKQSLLLMTGLILTFAFSV